MSKNANAGIVSIAVTNADVLSIAGANTDIISMTGTNTDVVMHNNVPTGKAGTITLTSEQLLTIENLNSNIVFTEGKNIILCNNKYETLQVISLGETYEPSKIVFLGETAVEPTE